MDNLKKTPQIRVSFFEILIVFLKIGAFTFGGGYVMIPIIQHELVYKKNWVDSKEFYDILAMIQSIPGPVALNTSIMIGKKLRGIKGGTAAIIGIALPSLIVIVAVAAIFFPIIKDNLFVQAAFYGIRPAVAALIAAAAFNMGKAIILDKYSFIIMVLLFTAGLLLNIHPIILIALGGISGCLYYKKESEDQ